MAKQQENQKVFGDLKPASSNLGKSASRFQNLDLRMSLHLPSRSIMFSSEVADKFNILHGDRIGFTFSESEPYAVFVYFSENPVGTHIIKKYKANPYKCHWPEVIIELLKRYQFKNSQSTNKLYISLKASLKQTINGHPETCYLVYDKPHMRDDLSEFHKELYVEKMKEIFAKIKLQ